MFYGVGAHALGLRAAAAATHRIIVQYVYGVFAVSDVTWSMVIRNETFEKNKLSVKTKSCERYCEY